MKILVPFLLLLLAFGQSLQAQENDTLPPPIDFKEYVEIMTPKMCDSIYRVDTLYYPFEGDVQMIEIRLKTVLKKETECSPILLTSFTNLSSIFLFRDEKGKFLNIYNTLNIIIDTSSLKSVDFVNSTAFTNDYIIIQEFNYNKLSEIYKILKDKEDDGHGYYNMLYHAQTEKLFKGLINKKGEIIFPAIYTYIALYKEDNSIVLLDDKKEKSNTTFYNYNDLSLIKHYENCYLIKQYAPYLLWNYNTRTNSLIDNRGNKLIDNMKNIFYTNNLTIVINKKNQYGLLNHRFEYILDTIYEHIDIYSKNDNEYFAHIRLNGKEGIISLDNKVLLPIEYDRVNVNKNIIKGEYIYLVEKNNLKGVLNEKFELVIPMKYSYIEVHSNHFLVNICTHPISNKERYEYSSKCLIGIYDSNYKLIKEPIFNARNNILNGVVFTIYSKGEKKNKSYVLYDFHNYKLKLKKINRTDVEYSHSDRKGNSILRAYNFDSYDKKHSRVKFIKLK